MQETLPRAEQRQWVLALKDVETSLEQSWFWLALGWNDIVQRYRGSILGPFWLTLTSGIFIAGLGPLYATLFNLNTREYLPFLAIGIICWNFMAGTINEACRAFIDAGSVMRQVKLPRMHHILHLMWRNIIIFAHNLPIIAAVLLYGGISVGLSSLWAIPGLVLMFFNVLCIGLAVAIVSARYRDVVQIIASILSLTFFLTPVMWNPSMQRVPEWLLFINPFGALIELVRAPLLGKPIMMSLLVTALLSSLASFAVSAWLLVRYRKHIVYWV